jgi:hypothetical protein
MKYAWIIATVIIVAGSLIAVNYTGILKGPLHQFINHPPQLAITYPENQSSQTRLVMISGTASDPDGDPITDVEVKIGDTNWTSADLTDTLWSYDWNTNAGSDGAVQISARAYDGKDYSKPQTVSVLVDNQRVLSTGSHRWAVFIATANFPPDNASKLGNGGLNLAERMADYFITNLSYDTDHTIILFDDGWVRSDNGYGKKIMTLQQRPHDYDITYGGATAANVITTLDQVINESNQFTDSEVFIWFFDHGYGNAESRNGGKILQNSALYLWDSLMTDKDLGTLLSPLTSKRVTVIIDACYAGGFADRTIASLPTSIFFKSGIPRSGRVILTGASKFDVGYASTTDGPLFTMLWFQGLQGAADGFRPGILNLGRPSLLFKDGKVSVEEAFYYAKYTLRTAKDLSDYKGMRPQINDRFPTRLGDLRGLILGQGS